MPNIYLKIVCLPIMLKLYLANDAVYDYDATTKDFLYFIHRMHRGDELSAVAASMLSHIKDRPSCLNPQWLIENPGFDYQGIPWNRISPDLSYCKHKLERAKTFRYELFGECRIADSELTVSIHA